MQYPKRIGLDKAIDMLLDPECEYDVIVRNGEGIILSRMTDPRFNPHTDELHVDPPKASILRRLTEKLSDE